MGTSKKDSSVKAREELLSTAAHDLKNPLGAIFGYADAILDTRLGEGLTPQQREITSRMRALAARAIDLVKNYQHLSQLGASPQARSGQADLNFIVQSVVQSTWREDPSRLTLTTELSPATAIVAIDPVSLERIVSNLLSNALQYTPPGGSVVVRTFIDPPHGTIEVFNSGCTIPQAELPHLFEVRFRGTTSQGVAGSGLGLYIVKRIVDSVSGSISVASDGAGTTFTARLPLQ